jgi:hypothetical protein
MNSPSPWLLVVLVSRARTMVPSGMFCVVLVSSMFCVTIRGHR